MKLPPLTRDGAIRLRLWILQICESPDSSPRLRRTLLRYCEKLAADFKLS